MSCLNRLNGNLHFFVAIVCLLMVGGCGPAKVAVPKAYKHWNSKDGSFAIDFPDGWRAEGNGNKTRGSAWAKFIEGPITVRVDSSFAASVVGDLAGGLMGGLANGDVADELKPVAKAQAHWKEFYEDKYHKYTEDDGETISIPLGETRVNRFKGIQGLTRLNGIRTTTLCRDRCVNFLAHCPEGQWEEFEPVFMKMLEGLKQGVEM